MVRRVSDRILGIFSPHRLRVHTENHLAAHATNRPHRYDARLLLDALPRIGRGTADPTAPTDATATAPSRPDSPRGGGGGWSDLPSDAEDTFFLTPDETADLHRTKRLRHLDALRTARLRALSPDDAPATGGAYDADDPWGGSDEEVRKKKTKALPKSPYTVLTHVSDMDSRMSSRWSSCAARRHT
jgi:hypothetical protein